MAQVTETVARGILAGHGYTDNEVRQLAHHWLATHGQAPAQPVDFTTLGAAMRAIQQAIGLIGAPTDERMRAVRRVLRGAVVVAEDSEDIPALPAPPAMDASPSAASIAWNALRDATDPLGELGARIMGHVRIYAQRQYEAGRAPTDSQPALDRTRIREIFMAHGFTVKEGQTDLKQYVYDAAEALLRAARDPADSVLEDAAFEAVRKKLCALPRYSFVLDDDGVVRRVRARAGNWIEFDEAHALLDPVAVDAARKQGGQHGTE